MIADGNSHCLSWERRIQIAIDAAEGQYNFIFEEAKSVFLLSIPFTFQIMFLGLYNLVKEHVFIFFIHDYVAMANSLLPCNCITGFMQLHSSGICVDV